MALPLMPKATAVWLVENTSLTFDQIGEFCGLHALEVQAIADGEVAVQMQGLDPVANGQLTLEEIERCQKDPTARLKLAKEAMPVPLVKHRGPRYTPIAKRQDKPDAISWLLKNHPELSDGQISKLVGTTKPTIAAVRDRTHWNSPNIKPRHPVALGLCTHGGARGRGGARQSRQEARRAADRWSSRRRSRRRWREDAARLSRALGARAEARAFEAVGDLAENGGVVDGGGHLVLLAIGDARIVPRRILPERVLGRRCTTTAVLKLATGPMRSRTSATISAAIRAGDRSAPGLQHQEAQRHLALERVGDADDGAFGDIGMRGQHLLDRAGREAVAGDIDDVVGARHDEDIAVLVDIAGIGGVVVAGIVGEIGAARSARRRSTASASEPGGSGSLTQSAPISPRFISCPSASSTRRS